MNEAGLYVFYTIRFLSYVFDLFHVNVLSLEQADRLFPARVGT